MTIGYIACAEIEIASLTCALLRMPLQLIANDAYKMGSFFYAAKAFDVLERLDPAPEYLDGKKVCTLIADA